MRFYEIKGGINMPLSNEELILVKRLEQNGTISSSDLDERGAELARLMVSKGILDRIENENSENQVFILNKLEDIWRY